MSIEYHIDHGRRLVLASASGMLTPEDLFNYQRIVWSLPEVRGFNELVDMRKVEDILSPTFEHISELAKLSADMDDNTISTIRPHSPIITINSVWKIYSNGCTNGHQT